MSMKELGSLIAWQYLSPFKIEMRRETLDAFSSDEVVISMGTGLVEELINTGRQLKTQVANQLFSEAKTREHAMAMWSSTTYLRERIL